MDAMELKRRIKRMQGLPALPQLAREVIRLGGDIAAEADELAAIASFDPELSRVLTRAANVASVRDAIFSLGQTGLVQTVLPYSVRRLFPEHTRTGFDMDVFWRHSVLTAELAQVLAAGLDPAWSRAAYGAGLCHNIGRLVLDLLLPQDTPLGDEWRGPDGRALLEAERRDVGIDHTLAGKWIAENWGLPEEYIAVIWLHHHPRGALDGTRYPVALVETVALASELAEARLGDASTADIVANASDTSLRRLNLTRESLAEILGAAREDAGPAPMQRGVFVPSDDTAHLCRLERRVTRLETLEQLHRDVCGARNVAELLTRAACAIREAFPAAWGFCYATDDELQCIEVRWWPSRSDVIREATVSLPAHDSGGAAPAPTTLMTALESIQEGALRDEPHGTTTAEFMRRPGLVMIPINGERRVEGQVLLDTEGLATGFTEEDLGDLRWFARAAGLALMRLHATTIMQRNNEEMANALTAHELEFQRRLRAERLAGIARLAAGAAHEINNPLAVISGRAQMMLNRNLAQEEERGLETIIEQSRRASKILTDLMQFARPPEPKLDATVIPFLLRQITVTLRPRFGRKRIRIVEQFSEGLPRVRLDRRRMEQVFVNLMVNAEQAMADTGGTLTLRAFASEDRKRVCVEIADTGPGIPRELHERIFEPFFTTRPQGEGTGLGLAVCHGIIESHGGTIEILSDLGRGATFRVMLPAAADTVPFVRPAALDKSDALHTPGQAAPALAREETASVTAPGKVISGKPDPVAAPVTGAQKPLTAPEPEQQHDATPIRPVLGTAQTSDSPAILIVDSDLDLREILKETFQGRGCRALGASDSVEAMALFAGYRLDLIILDISMPHRDGLALLRALRERDRDIPVVVLTGMATDEEIREALDLGVRACLQKPFELKRLLAEIDEALASRSAA